MNRIKVLIGLNCSHYCGIESFITVYIWMLILNPKENIRVLGNLLWFYFTADNLMKDKSKLFYPEI